MAPTRFRSLLSLTMVLGGAFSGCMGPPPGPGSAPAVDAPTPISFDRSVIDPVRRGFEPALVVSGDGRLYVCSVRALGSGSDLWWSADGSSFHYVGAGADRGPVLRTGTADLGGGDCDVATDASGRAYMADGWLGSVSVLRSEDGGRSWEGTPVSLPGPLDRPWALGGAEDELWVAANQLGPAGVWVARSTDGGRTFPQQAIAAPNPPNRIGLHSNLALGGERLFMAYLRPLEGVDRTPFALMVAASDDRGATWRAVEVARQEYIPGGGCGALVVFPVVAADAQGGVYLAWALQNNATGRVDLFLASSPDGGRTWNAPFLLTDRPGARAFPWMAATPGGRLGVVWYETDRPALLRQEGAACAWVNSDDAPWHVRFALLDAFASGVPRVREVLVQPEPAHVGPLDRPYAERIDVEFTSEGVPVVVYVADVTEGAARAVIARGAGFVPAGVVAAAPTGGPSSSSPGEPRLPAPPFS